MGIKTCCFEESGILVEIAADDVGLLAGRFHFEVSHEALPGFLFTPCPRRGDAEIETERSSLRRQDGGPFPHQVGVFEPSRLAGDQRQLGNRAQVRRVELETLFEVASRLFGLSQPHARGAPGGPGVDEPGIPFQCVGQYGFAWRLFG